MVLENCSSSNYLLTTVFIFCWNLLWRGFLWTSRRSRNIREFCDSGIVGPWRTGCPNPQQTCLAYRQLVGLCVYSDSVYFSKTAWFLLMIPKTFAAMRTISVKKMHVFWKCFVCLMKVNTNFFFREIGILACHMTFIIPHVCSKLSCAFSKVDLLLFVGLKIVSFKVLMLLARARY